LRRTAEEVAAATVFGPLEATDALVGLTRATGDATEAQNMLGTTAKLAQASFGKLTLTQSTTMVSDMAKAFGMSSSEVERAGDAILATSLKAGVGLEELRKIMGYLGTAAVRGGQSFDTMLQSFIMARRILPSSRRAATQLGRVMGEIGKKDAVNAFADIGIRVRNAQGNMRDFTSILMDMAKVAKTNMPAVRETLENAFGEAATKPMLAMIALMQKGMKSMGKESVTGTAVLKSLNMSIGNSKGMMDKAAKAYMETADAGLRRLNEAWEQMKVAIGEELLPHLGRAAKALADVLLVTRDIVKQVPGISHFFSALVKVGTLVVAFKAVKLAFAAYVQIMRSAKGFYAAFIDQQRQMGGAIMDTAKKTAAAQKIYQASTAVPIVPGAGARRTAGRGAAIEAEWTRTDQARAPISRQLTAGSKAMVVYTGKTQAAAGAMSTLSRTTRGTTKLLTGTVSTVGRFSKVAGMAKTAAVGFGTALKAVGSYLAGGIITMGIIAIIESISRFQEQVDYFKSKGFRETLKSIKEASGGKGLLYETLGLKKFVVLHEWASGRTVEQQLKEFKILELQEKFKDLFHKRRALRDKLNFQEGQAKMEMGTRPFVQAVNKLENQLKYKPKLIKKSDIQLLRGELDRIIKTGAGGVFEARGGRRMKLTSRDIDYAREGLLRLDKSVGLIKKVQLKGGEIKSKEAIAIGDAMMVAYSAIRDVSPEAPKAYLANLMAPATALLHSIKKPAQEAERLAQMTVGPRNVATGALFGTRPGLPIDREREAFEKGGMETIPASVGGTMGLRSVVGQALGFVKEAGVTIPMAKPMEASMGPESEMAQAQQDTVRHLETVSKDIADIAKSIQLVKQHGLNVKLPTRDPGWEDKPSFPITR
jgi:TP901 family phage tail tape measure protein